MTLKELFKCFPDLFDAIVITNINAETVATNYYFIAQIVEDKALIRYKKIYLEENYNAILRKFGDFIVEDWIYRARTNAISLIIRRNEDDS